MGKTETNIPELDQEWVQLIIEALEMGIDKEEIRTFLVAQQKISR